MVAKPLPRERAPLSRLCRLVIAVHQRPERVFDRTRRVSHVRVPQLVPLQLRNQLCPLAEWARELLARQDGSGRRQWNERHFLGEWWDERAGGYGRDRYGDDVDRRAEGRRRQHLCARTRRESRNGGLHRSVRHILFPCFSFRSALTWNRTGYYSYPCSANVTVGLTFGGVVRFLIPLSLNLLPSPNSCSSTRTLTNVFPRSRAQTYNMSTADFNLGPFGIDPQTNASTCLGAFFDLAFSGGSRISWVVSRSCMIASFKCTRGVWGHFSVLPDLAVLVLDLQPTDSQPEQIDSCRRSAPPSSRTSTRSFAPHPPPSGSQPSRIPRTRCRSSRLPTRPTPPTTGT